MAKQNFIAGGFYGKLGETVGQRWKNKRTMRVYVVPKDPRTPEQVAFRSKFRSSVPLAQFAMRLNKGAPCWDNDNITEWQYRMSTAKLRVDAGVQYPLTVPLYPNGYTPAISVDGLSIVARSSTQYSVLSDSGYMFPTDRKLILVVQARNISTDLIEEVVVYANGYAEGGYLMDFTLPNGYAVAPDALIYGVSTDDREHDNQMVAIPLQGVSQASVVVIDDWTYTYNLDGTLTLQSDMLGTVQSNHVLSLSLTMRNITTGGLEGVVQEVNTQANVDTITLPASFAKYAFWSDTYIAGSDITQASTTEKVIIPQIQVGTETKKTVNQSAMGFAGQYSVEVYNDWDSAQITLNARYDNALFAGKFTADSLLLDFTYKGASAQESASVSALTNSGSASDVVALIKAEALGASLDDVQSSVSLSLCKLVNDWAEVLVTDSAVTFSPAYAPAVEITDWNTNIDAGSTFHIGSDMLAKITEDYTIPLVVHAHNWQSGANVNGTYNITLSNKTDNWWTLSSVSDTWWGNDSTIQIASEITIRPNIRIAPNITQLTNVQKLQISASSQPSYDGNSGLWFEEEEFANFTLRFAFMPDTPYNFSWNVTGVTLNLNIALSNGTYNQTADLDDDLSEISSGSSGPAKTLIIRGRRFISGATNVAGTNGTWSLNKAIVLSNDWVDMTLPVPTGKTLYPREY